MSVRARRGRRDGGMGTFLGDTLYQAAWKGTGCARGDGGRFEAILFCVFGMARL